MSSDSLVLYWDWIDDVEESIEGVYSLEDGFVPEDLDTDLAPGVRDEEAGFEVGCGGEEFDDLEERMNERWEGEWERGSRGGGRKEEGKGGRRGRRRARGQSVSD